MEMAPPAAAIAASRQRVLPQHLVGITAAQCCAFDHRRHACRCLARPRAHTRRGSHQHAGSAGAASRQDIHMRNCFRAGQQAAQVMRLISYSV